MQNELIKKCLCFLSLNNWVWIHYVNTTAHTEERLSWFAARDTASVWLWEFTMFGPSVILVKLRQMKTSRCLIFFKHFFFPSLESLAPSQPSCCFYPCRMIFDETAILFLFLTYIFTSLAQRNEKLCFPQSNQINKLD